MIYKYDYLIDSKSQVVITGNTWQNLVKCVGIKFIAYEITSLFSLF